MLLVGLGFVLGLGHMLRGQTTRYWGGPAFAPVLILVGGRCTWLYFGGMNHKQENLVADEVDGTEGHIALGKNRLLGYNSSLSKKCWPRLSGSAGNTENESGNT